MKWQNLKMPYTDHLERLKKKNAYDLLELSHNVTLKELKTAYRDKVKVYHPDGKDSFFHDYSQEVMKLLNLAYEKIKRDIKGEI